MAQRVFGLHAVRSLLERSPARVSVLLALESRADARMQAILELAEKANVPVRRVARTELDERVPGVSHQGVVAEMAVAAALSENELPQFLDGLGKPPLLLILDGVQDPHNLGACLRSADGAGVDAVIAPRDRAGGLTPIVCKVASGAAESVPYIQVTNLARTLDQLKERGVWLVGTAGEAEVSLYQADLKGPLGLVMGEKSGAAVPSFSIVDSVTAIGVSPSSRRCGCGRVARQPSRLLPS